MTATVSYNPEEWEDRIADVLAKLDPDGGWQDHGIGSYEFQGARGNDVQWAFAAEDIGPAWVCMLEAPEDVELWRVQVEYRGGGCDGEHRSSCKPCCTEWDVLVNWTPGSREMRDGTLWVEWNGATA